MQIEIKQLQAPIAHQHKQNDANGIILLAQQVPDCFSLTWEERPTALPHHHTIRGQRYSTGLKIGCFHLDMEPGMEHDLKLQLALTRHNVLLGVLYSSTNVR